MPVQAAGSRVEHPASVANAIGVRPAATATPAPADEPPQVNSGAQGLRVTPVSGEVPSGECANSVVVVLPMMMAPAARRRATAAISAAAGLRLGHQRRAPAGRQAGDVENVLDRDRHARQRARISSLLDLACQRSARAVAPAWSMVDERVQLALQPVRALEGVADRLARVAPARPMVVRQRRRLRQRLADESRAGRCHTGRHSALSTSRLS